MTVHADTSSATPLSALSAVVLDTETTSLNVDKARILQIGGVRIFRGKIESKDKFDTLVNPGEPIPEESTRIHGIDDIHVADAESFTEVFPVLENWIESAIVIGYSIGYDLAVIQREMDLCGLPWTAPRTLDVRHMVRVLEPQLPEYSLEMVAGWLGISTENRHQALADAEMTADVFLALLPKLSGKGIRTVAELELACRQVGNNRVMEAEAGWFDFLQQNRDEHGINRTLARIDSYPYRHRVREVMSSPVVTIPSTATVRIALDTLIDRKVSSLFVQLPGSEEEIGIATERDILRAINKNAQDALDKPIGEIASTGLISVPRNAFIYRAMGLMTRHKIRHLGVRNKSGNIVGVLTSRDLLKQRSDDALNLGDAINQAQNPSELNLVWANLALVATALDREDVDARDIAAVISRELRALTRRACEIAEKEMAKEELGPPPAPYCMMVLGSGGRGESLLAMDQDNAIVYSDETSKKTGVENTDQWFADLGSRVSALLDSCGVPYCKGGIMGMNKEWRMPTSEWKRHIETWITRTSPQDILNTDIFFDAVSVHGDHALMDEIYNHAMEIGSRSREFLHLLTTNAADTSIPLGAFGRFKLKKDRMDIKIGGLLPIFSAARVEAIRNRISERSTPGRLRELKSIDSYKPHTIDNLEEAHRIVLTSILKQQLYDLDNGLPLSNWVAPEKMKPSMRNNLKWALEQVNSVNDLLDIPH